MHTSFAVQPNHALDPNIPKGSRPRLRLTGYRIANVVASLLFVIVKGAMAFNNQSNLANVGDLLMGIVCGMM